MGLRPFRRSTLANIRLFYVYRGLFGLALGIAGPILTLFFLEKGLSLAQFMILMGVLNVSITVFEIPTGIVADRIGRRFSVVMGLVLEAVGFTGLLLLTQFGQLSIAFVCWGLGESFVSGADSALFYDSIKNTGQEAAAERLMGTSVSILTTCGVAGSLICSPVVKVLGLSAPLAIAVAIFPFMIIVGLLFVEPSRAKASSDPERASGPGDSILRGYMQHIGGSFKLIGRDRQVLTIMITFVALGRLIFLVNRPYAQPYLLSFGHAAALFGLLFAGYRVASAGASKFSHHVLRALGGSERGMQTLVILLAIAQLSFFALTRSPQIALFALGGAFLVDGLATPALRASLNRRLPSERRAACLSIASAANHLLGLLLGPIYGYLCDSFSLQTGLRVFMLSFGPVLLVCLVLIRIYLPGRPTASEDAG